MLIQCGSVFGQQKIELLHLAGQSQVLVLGLASPRISAAPFINFQSTNSVVHRNGYVCWLVFCANAVQWTTLHTVQYTGLYQGTILQSVHSFVMAVFSPGYERMNQSRDLIMMRKRDGARVLYRLQDYSDRLQLSHTDQWEQFDNVKSAGERRTFSNNGRCGGGFLGFFFQLSGLQ